MNEIMSVLEIGAPIILGRIISVTNEQVKHYADFQIYFIGVTSTILIIVLLIYVVVQIKRGVVANWDSLRVSLEELLKDDVENLGKKHMTSKSNIEKYFINNPKGCINYAELLLDVVNQTDNENWDYFSEGNSELAKDFLNYGYFSRVLMIRDYENKREVPVGYVQLRVLKNTAPQLLYKDLYHHAGLEGHDLWEKTNHLKAGLPIYIDVIAIKKEYQGKTGVLKLVPVALLDIIDEISNITHESFDIYAVGVTDEGRKMCKMFGMEFLSEVLRKEGETNHTRVLFGSNYSDFVKRLGKRAGK